MSMRPEDMKKVGGSDVAAIMGLSPYRTALGVWTRIVHGVEVPDNAAMRRGRALEAGVLALYAEETGRLLYQPPGDDGEAPVPSPWRATLDARSRTCIGAPMRVVEVKTAGRNATGWGEPGTSEVPHGYALQVQWYLGWGLRTGRVEDAQADVAALLSGEFAIYHVQYDAEVFGLVLERCERFWCDHVVTGRPPENEPTEQDAALVSRIRRAPDVPPIDWSALDPAGQTEVLRAIQAHAALARAEREAKAARTAAQLRIAGSSGVVGIPAEYGYSAIEWPERKGRTTVDWEAVARELLVAQRCDPVATMALIDKHTTQGAVTRAWSPRPLKKEGNEE